MIGGAMAISDGLTGEETVSVVCHTIGHILGLENSDDPGSCMSHAFEPGVLTWYTQADADAVVALYAHDESATTSTTVAPTTTPTGPTTTTVEPTTTAPDTTSTTTPPDATSTTDAPTTTAPTDSTTTSVSS